MQQAATEDMVQRNGGEPREECIVDCCGRRERGKPTAQRRHGQLWHRNTHLVPQGHGHRPTFPARHHPCCLIHDASGATSCQCGRMQLTAADRAGIRCSRGERAACTAKRYPSERVLVLRRHQRCAALLTSLPCDLCWARTAGRLRWRFTDRPCGPRCGLRQLQGERGGNGRR